MNFIPSYAVVRVDGFRTTGAQVRTYSPDAVSFVSSLKAKAEFLKLHWTDFLVSYLGRTNIYDSFRLFRYNAIELKNPDEKLKATEQLIHT